MLPSRCHSRARKSTLKIVQSRVQVIQDLGSGMNYQKKGLKALIQLILERKISRLVLAHKDRLLRFGAELIFAICEAKQIEFVLINKGDEIFFEEELARDVLEIITVFAARLYGSRREILISL